MFKRGFKTVREAKQFMNSFMARLDGNQDMVSNDYIEIYYSDREAHLKLNTFLTKKNIIEKTSVLTLLVISWLKSLQKSS